MHSLKTSRSFGAMVGFVAATLVSSASFALSLTEAHDRMQKVDPELLRGEISVSLAESRKDQARANLLPKLSTVLSTSQTEREQYGIDERYQGEDYSLILAQPVLNIPLWKEVDRLGALTDVRKASFDDLAQRRRLELISTYAQWVESEIRHTLLSARLRAVEKRLSQVQELYTNRRVNLTQVLTVENERDRVSAEFAKAQTMLTSARSAVRVMTNLDDIPQFSRNSLNIERFPVNQSMIDRVTEAGSEHPLIRQAIAQRAVASHVLDQAESRWFPKIDARIQMRHTNIGSNDAETFPVDSSTAQLTLSWDIFDSGARSAAIREAELGLRDAELAMMQARQEIDQQAVSVESEIAQFREAWMSANAEYSSAKRLVSAADKSFDLGVGTIGDSLRALERLVDAESRLTTRWLEAVVGIARLAQVNDQLSEDFLMMLSDEFGS